MMLHTVHCVAPTIQFIMMMLHTVHCVAPTIQFIIATDNILYIHA